MHFKCEVYYTLVVQFPVSGGQEHVVWLSTLPCNAEERVLYLGAKWTTSWDGPASFRLCQLPPKTAAISLALLYWKLVVC